ncbi:T9SS type A sorting domain-containing protein [Chryseobacterium sp. PS-8]|uniref:T9SS type A sorting domain-containing protein n=1 Tax=Chryseobacterium indicum TaxID=2766954 RepID=A0ABS9C6Z1_9FLAO|nr:T9SS type A sorting domain-containing protein [Chryseobacterium sp. PS-8]MCF2219952.1 T9SS type A sorting domain-containing protein [Chryseobacterium sp. PS-8]
MKKFYIAIILILFPLLTFAQGENDNWYFGNYAAINFSSPSPIVFTNSQMTTNGASASVSDSNGKLLFYTNGISVWTREHTIMPNGGNIMQETPMQIAIVKHPSNPNLYYIFSGGVVSSSNTFVARYSVVNMSLGNLGLDGFSLGDVVQSQTNIPILDEFGNDFTTAKGVTIVPQIDNASFWVLIPTMTKLYSYPLNNTGFVNNPVTSSLNIENAYPSPFQHYAYIKASPKLKSLCKSFSHYLSFSSEDFVNSYNEGRVYSFDDSTGQITNAYELTIASLTPILTEFNKDGSILYVGTHLSTNIYAVNMLASTNNNIIYNSIANTITGSVDFQGIQRNKYGDIYFKYAYIQNNYIGKINNPDVFGGASLDLYNLNISPGYSSTNPNLFPQLVPTLNTNNTSNNCVPNIVKNSQETNNIHTYHASNTIITNTAYVIDAGKNITMKAGESITLLPNTYIKNGAKYYAKIEGCGEPCEGEIEEKKQNVKLFMDLRKKLPDVHGSDINLYPNPASDFLTIQSTLKVENVNIYDISGKKINTVLNGNTIDIKHIPSGSYLITIETKEGKTTKKFIKK